MALVLGIFDTRATPAKLDDVLEALYSGTYADVDTDDVTLINNSAGRGTVSETVLPVVPLTTASPNDGEVGHQGAGVALVATGLVQDLNLDDESMEYFRRVARDGAEVVFVDVEDKHADAILDLFRRNMASRAEVLR